MKLYESSMVILSLPNGECVILPPTQGGAAESNSLLKAVSQHQKPSFMIMNDSAGDFVYHDIRMGCLKFTV